MSYVTITITTTTPPVTIVCSGASLITMIGTLGPTSVGQILLGQWDVVLLPQLILQDTLRDSAGLTHMPQQHIPQSWVSSQAYATYALGPLQVSSSSEMSLPQFLYHVLGVLWCLLSGSHVAVMITYGGSFLGLCDTTTLSLPMVGICVSWWWSVTHTGVHGMAVSSSALSQEEPSATHLMAPQQFQQYGVAYSSWGLADLPDPSAFPTWLGGVFLQVALHLITWSTVNLW